MTGHGGGVRPLRWLRHGVAVVVIAAAVAACGSEPARSGSDDAGPGAEISGRIDDLFAASAVGAYDSVRAVVVVHEGDTIVESYFGSAPEDSYDVYSITKSVLSTLMGIAESDGALRRDQTVGELLPTYRPWMDGVESVTVEQLLMMTGGLPADREGVELPFVADPNWVRSILQGGRTGPPGRAFAYSSASSHLLAAVLTEAVGQPLLDYARPRLFDPLGIDTEEAATPVVLAANQKAYEEAGFAWPTDPQGIHTGHDWLKLTATDVARLGALYAQSGRWDGEQLLPEGWVRDATTTQVKVGDESGYGYQWWTTSIQGHPAFVALGGGMQVLQVLPDLELVIVALADAEGRSANAVSNSQLGETLTSIVLSTLADS